jgi:uncharacterized membrane protein YedE/YeeE
MSAAPATLRAVTSLATGTLFGIGLAVAQMTNPRKVLAFLDLSGAWDPSLLLVLGGAVTFAAATFRWILRRPAPQLDARFHLPDFSAIDWRLINGAALFGIGWGLAGYCPGPAIASLGFGNAEALWVVPSLVLGGALQLWLDRPGRHGIGHSKIPLDVLEI